MFIQIRFSRRKQWLWVAKIETGGVQVGFSLSSIIFLITIKGQIHLIHVPHHVVQGLCKVVDIAGIQASHTDATVLGHVDVPFLSNGEDLLLGDSGEAEHTDLTGDVIPVSRSVEFV